MRWLVAGLAGAMLLVGGVLVVVQLRERPRSRGRDVPALVVGCAGVLAGAWMLTLLAVTS